jgi:NAD(P)-dependent dehydrogenase (short-subunit alcohol dehydrogenase family)
LAETVAIVEAVGGRCLAVTAEITDQAAVDRVVAETEAKFGPVDILISNAAITTPVGPLWEIGPDSWERTLDVNLIGPMRIAHTVLKGMVQRRRGQVVFVSSGAGAFAGPYDGAYRVSKAALIRLAEVTAMETKEYGISVFSIHPGVVSTEAHKSATDTLEGRKYLPEFGERAKQFATPIELAAKLCVYLASGAADALTGRYFSVNDDPAAITAETTSILESDLYTLRLRMPPRL